MVLDMTRQERRMGWGALTMVALAMTGCLAEVPQEPMGVTEAPQAFAPSLDAAPVLEVGDWWHYRLTLTPFNDHTEEVTIVVADVTDAHYRIGMPADDFNDLAFAFHFPPMGEVARRDLSWEMHEHPFKILDFPLTNASTWGIDVVGYKGRAAVDVTSATTATVTIAPFLAPVRAEYDASVGLFTRLGIDDYGFVELLDHGSGFQGDVLVPVDQQTIFYGRAAGLAAIDDPWFRLPPMDPDQPGVGVNPTPTDVVVLPERGHLSLVQWVGTFFLVPAATPGAFMEHAEAPDGTVYEISRTPADGEGVSMQYFHVKNPGGEWTFTHVAAGGGIATSEGVAFNTLAFTLPPSTEAEAQAVASG